MAQEVRKGELYYCIFTANYSAMSLVL